MDPVVLQAIVKWPNVPAAYGWLRLDQRGRWYTKGSRIAHDGLIAFIGRNYTSDEDGRWFFQNGPQRVYVTLEYTPWVFSLQPQGDHHSLLTHTGLEVETINRVFIDNEGQMLFDTPLGIGVLFDFDLPFAMEWVVNESGAKVSDSELLDWLEEGSAPLFFAWRTQRILLEHIRKRDVRFDFDFEPDPQPEEGEPEC